MTAPETDPVREILRIGNEAIEEARQERIKKGLPSVYSINGTLIWQMPDGSITTEEPFQDEESPDVSTSQ